MKYLGIPQSGSLAGTVFSHNRAGQYTRNRRAPVQPIGTGRRAAVRATLGSASANYAALTSAQQAAWTAFALLYPVVDALGQSIKLTAHQMYVRCAASLVNVGQVLPTDPPLTNAVPDVSAATVAASLVHGITIGNVTGTGADFVTFGVSQRVPASRSFWKTFWSPLGTDRFSSVTALPATITTGTYTTQFGAPALGDKLFVKITPVNTGGFNGAPIILQTLWGA